jgi:hypothetical protein
MLALAHPDGMSDGALICFLPQLEQADIDLPQIVPLPARDNKKRKPPGRGQGLWQNRAGGWIARDQLAEYRNRNALLTG